MDPAQPYPPIDNGDVPALNRELADVTVKRLNYARHVAELRMQLADAQDGMKLREAVIVANDPENPDLSLPPLITGKNQQQRDASLALILMDDRIYQSHKRQALTASRSIALLEAEIDAASYRARQLLANLALADSIINAHGVLGILTGTAAAKAGA